MGFHFFTIVGTIKKNEQFYWPIEKNNAEIVFCNNERLSEVIPSKTIRFQ